MNYYLLTAFTFCKAYFVSYFCAKVEDRVIVLQAAGLTAGMVAGITAYALITKTEFNVKGGMISVASTTLLLFGIFSILLGPTLILVYCLIGVIFFGFYLVIDT